jgi:aminodeoxyfutalosine deaminase
MRYFSAQYVFTNEGAPLNRAVVCTEEDGTIVRVEETGGRLSERHSVEFYNGIIIPGFINCHSHLELSHLKGNIRGGKGLASFLEGVTANRNMVTKDQVKEIAAYDKIMAAEGVVACADVCNSAVTFELKGKSAIRYMNLLEVYGFDPANASKRIDEIQRVAKVADSMGLSYNIVPHSVYSVSKPLFFLIKKLAQNNTVNSIHFLESDEEKMFLSEQSGPLMEAYRKILSPDALPDPPSGHISAITDLVTQSGSLILVHNTAIEKWNITELNKRDNLWYCLCPNSNLYIENKLPPVSLLTESGCNIVIGTDSLSSNSRLSMLSEMITINQNFPSITLEEIIRWATFNGAKALGEESWAGSITEGKRPGLVLISDCDLVNMKLLRQSSARRLI